MDSIVQIPHASQQDFVTASDKLTFPHLDKIDPSAPHQKVHDEALAVMPLVDTPSASSPNLIHSSEFLPNDGFAENFV